MAKTPKTFKTRVQEKLEDEDSYRDLYTEALDKIEEQMDDDIVNNSDLEKKPSLIKDAIRKDASVYYLSKPDLSIDEIALLMGFSEASSFHRAFKKWTGVTPGAWREGERGDLAE